MGFSIKPKKLNLFSFFAGVGLLDLGFEMDGFEISFVNELRPSFMEAYKYSRERLRFGEPCYGYDTGDSKRFLEGDLKKRLSKLIRDVRRSGQLIGFIGGPPCPDFSIGGKNRGYQGDHGRLSQSFIEIICQQRPDFFLFENVKGLWQTSRHRIFYEGLKRTLLAARYGITERLINAIEYGTPQDRERIILFGVSMRLLSDLRVNGLNGTGILQEGIFPWSKYSVYPGRKAFGFPWPETDTFEEDSIRPCPEGVPVELTVQHWFDKNDVTNHPNAEHFFKPRAGLARFMSVDEGDDSRKSFKRLHRWRYSPTACYGNNEVHIHPYKPRRISVAEALAVQSMPKEFIFPPNMTLSDMFKAIGNGVPYIASRALAKSISDFLRC